MSKPTNSSRAPDQPLPFPHRAPWFAVSVPGALALLGLLLLGSCDKPGPTEVVNHTLTVEVAGYGKGRVTSDPGGIDCTAGSGTCTVTLPQGTQVSLTGTPDERSSFGGWSQACSGTDACTVTLNSDRSVRASFENPRLVAQEIGPAGGTLRSLDERLTLTVPAGALSAATTLTVEAIETSELGPEFADLEVDAAYRLGPSGQTFATPIQITIRSEQQLQISGDTLSLEAELLFTSTAGALELLDSLETQAALDGSVSVTGRNSHFSTVAKTHREEVSTKVAVPGELAIGHQAGIQALIRATRPNWQVSNSYIEARTQSPLQLVGLTPGERRPLDGEPVTIECTEEGIGRVEILVGAHASAIYGSAATGGVVSISTRRSVECFVPPVPIFQFTPSTLSANLQAERSYSEPIGEITLRNLGDRNLYFQASITPGHLFTRSGDVRDPDEPYFDLRPTEGSIGPGGSTVFEVDLTKPIPQWVSHVSAEVRTAVSAWPSGPPVEAVVPVNINLTWQPGGPPTFSAQPILGPPTPATGPIRAIAAQPSADLSQPGILWGVGQKDLFDQHVLTRIDLASGTTNGFILPFTANPQETVNGIHFGANGITAVGTQGRAVCTVQGTCVLQQPLGFSPGTGALHTIDGNGSLEVITGQVGNDVFAWINGNRTALPFSLGPGETRPVAAHVTHNNDIYVSGWRQGVEHGFAYVHPDTMLWVGTAFDWIHAFGSRPQGTGPDKVVLIGGPNGLPSEVYGFSPGSDLGSLLRVNDAFLRFGGSIRNDPVSPIFAAGRVSGQSSTYVGALSGPDHRQVHSTQVAGIITTNIAAWRVAEGEYRGIFAQEPLPSEPNTIRGMSIGWTPSGLTTTPWSIATPLVTAPLIADLNGVAAGQGGVSAVGEKGVTIDLRGAIRPDARVLALQSSPAFFRFTGVYRPAHDPNAPPGPRISIAVGTDGAIYEQRVSPGQPGPSAHTTGVRLFAADASGWTRMQNPAETLGITLYAVDGSGPDDVYAVGGAGMVLHFDGTAWRQVSAGLGGNALLLAVWSGGRDNVYIGGMASGVAFIRHFDGIVWRPVSLPTLQPGDAVVGIWGSGPSDVWGVTQAGAILHFDGTSWTSDNYQTMAGIPGGRRVYTGIAGSGPSDVFVVAEGAPGLLASVVLHFDGTGWTTVHEELNHRLRAVAVNSDGDVWVVGSGGLVLRGVR